jgi:hypothetical protein
MPCVCRAFFFRIEEVGLAAVLIAIGIAKAGYRMPDAGY